MNSIEIHPLSAPPDAEVTVPGSKSDTNRAFIIAALADGQTTLNGALFSDDTRYMAEALRSLGFHIVMNASAQTIQIDGQNGRIPARSGDLFLGNSGTSIRFLTAFAALGQGRYRLDGVDRMRERPIQPLLDGLTQLGVRATSEQGNGCPPVTIETNGLQGGQARMDGNQSSQYFSALMLVGPYTSKGIEIAVEGQLVHAPYIDLTATVMQRFGATMHHEKYQRLTVPGNQRYQAQSYQVEPDASAASYFFAAAAVTGGRVRVNGLGTDCAQGDLRFVDVLEQMGCQVVRHTQYTEVTGPEQLKGIDVDMNDITDTALTLAAIAPFADAPVTIRGIAHTRKHETDRITAPVTELRRLGVNTEEFPGHMVIHPSIPCGGKINTYEDHRMAMSFALIGLRIPGIHILDPDCTAKTFPDFFDRLERLRG